MGEAFINLARQIPNGVLIIFASYQLLEKTYGIWSNAPSEISSPSKNTILKRLEDIKPIIREPKKTGMLSERMLQYVKLAKTTKGAILMAVCRGKISEGIDFSDELARAVFIVGIPFPPLYDRRVELKQRYLDTVGLNRIENKRRLTGKEWYFLQAIRAMNQSIGRVIRHKNDYGCVLFFDIRFGNSDVKKEVSGWVRDEMKVFEHFGHGLKEVLEFFKRKRQPTNAVQLNKILKVTMDNKPYTNSNINTNNGMTIIKKASNDNEEFVGLARPELKKIKTEEDRPNYQVLDSMNELMCLDFDNNQDNNHRNLQLPFLNHQENTSNFNITDNFHNNSIKINNSFENGCKNDINTDSLANFIKTERENTESSLKSEELPIKKSITVEDLKKLRSRDDLRNCALTIDSLEELETYRSFLSQREKFECMICFMNKDELFSSKCGHMACLECWKRWLKEKLVCPKCKARVREKTLIRVFNN